MEKPESGNKTWKSVWIWAKMPQNRLKINNGEIFTPKKPEFTYKA